MKTEIKNNCVIIEEDTSGIETVIFRVFHNSQMVYYASSRLGTVSITPDGFVIQLQPDHIGLDYELKALPSKRIISKGKLTNSIEDAE